jgi:hypothetical protein
VGGTGVWVGAVVGLGWGVSVADCVGTTAVGATVGAAVQATKTTKRRMENINFFMRLLPFPGSWSNLDLNVDH